ncbi:XLF-domain-containing protein [Xylaria palmicola]|nr:XLF-domain-containing protein [Xylaria palmicola]
MKPQVGQLTVLVASTYEFPIHSSRRRAQHNSNDADIPTGIMESPCKWYPLPAFPQLPVLLASARFGESSYTLYVTDLAHVWVEKLDRRAILLRSLQENTSIDLVDADPEQWAVFLSKLKAAFDPASPDHRLTSLDIAASTHSSNLGDLVLRITCELPKPLDALRWPINLVKCQPVSLTSELVLPLIQQQYVQSREAEDLMGQLKEKDALISKLLDKLNSMHTPLELIFNSLSAKHAATRAAAEERIKGLAPFNKDKWRSQRSVESPQDAYDLLHSVFDDSSFGGSLSSGLGVSDTLNDWWAKLGQGFRAASENQTSLSSREPKETTRDKSTGSGDVDDEDFEVQVTPSSPRPPTSDKSAGGKQSHDATDSDESDIPGSHPTRPQSKPRSRIGTLGRTKQRARSNSPSQSSRTIHPDENDTASESEAEGSSGKRKHTGQSSTRLETIGKSKPSPRLEKAASARASSAESNSETASGSDSGSDGPSRPGSSPTRAPMTPRKGALGRIGGKSKNTASSPQTSKQPTPGNGSDNSPPSRKTDHRKIGAIERKPHIESKRVHPDTPAEIEEPETEEQKAERKRAELAKELNQKSTLPARKKRKF